MTPRGRRKALLILTIGSVLVGGAVALELMLENGFSARDEPTVVDAFVARWWRRFAVPRAERAARNPLPPTREVLSRGREHFAADCALCHGTDGRGATRLGRGLYPRPPDLTSSTTQSLPDGELFWVIQNGVRLSGMPAWSRDTEEQDQWTWEIVHFIRELPRLSVKDVKDVQAMVPRIPRDVDEEAAARRFLGGPETAVRPSVSAHHVATLMGSVTVVDPVRLQMRTVDGDSVSFLLSSSTRLVRGGQTVRADDLRIGERIVVRAARDQDWWLASEVRVARKEREP